MSKDSGWRRFQPRKRSTIIATAVAGAVVVSGAAVSAATLVPGQDASAAARSATANRAAYQPNSLWGPRQTSVDRTLQTQAKHTAAGMERAALKKREAARAAARRRARALAMKRAAEAAKKAREAREAREARASRSDDRAPAGGGAAKHSSSPAPASTALTGSPKDIAKKLLAQRGWSDQFSCLDQLWMKESGWQVHAENPSGAYGIPQALPGSKMSSAGPDWQDNAATQIKWGLGYISDRYGTPCAAWSHSEADNWY